MGVARSGRQAAAPSAEAGRQAALLTDTASVITSAGYWPLGFTVRASRLATSACSAGRTVIAAGHLERSHDR